VTLEVCAEVRLGAFRLDVDFAVAGGLTALFGRSGSGKTTLVNTIAGLVAPARGRVILDGTTLLDTGRRIAVPAHRRRLGYVFQDARLFPHLTVRANLNYGRAFAPARERRESLDRVVELLALGPLLARGPNGLSGGEKQRVAIGRALMASPRLLLMDEPLASLDEARKAEILPYIERLRDQGGLPIVYVSHSVGEVARLATTLVVLEAGRVTALGETGEVMSRLDLLPLTDRLDAGAVLEARVAGHDLGYGITALDTAAGPLRVPLVAAAPGTALRVRVRARDVLLATAPPLEISALNVLEGTVVEIASGAGPSVDVRLDCGGAALIARVTRLSVAALGLAPGRRVYAVIKSIAFDQRTLGAPLEGG